jgi:transcriptional antiterminator
MSFVQNITTALSYLDDRRKNIKLSFAKNILHKLSKSLHNNNNNFKIEERRRKVASMLAQSMTKTEIAEQLNVDQSTISRDIKALKELSQQFVFDLAYYYKQSIDGIEAKKEEILLGQCMVLINASLSYICSY